MLGKIVRVIILFFVAIFCSVIYWADVLIRKLYRAITFLIMCSVIMLLKLCASTVKTPVKKSGDTR